MIVAQVLTSIQPLTATLFEVESMIVHEFMQRWITKRAIHRTLKNRMVLSYVLRFKEPQPIKHFAPFQGIAD